MKVIRKCLTVACALGMLLALASRASAKTQEEGCRDKVYNTARKVLDQEQKNNRKTSVKGQTGSGDACVTPDSAKAEAQGDKLRALFDFGNQCDPVPTGVNDANGDAIVDAMESAADDIARDIFGPSVDGLDASKCQDKLIQRPGQAAAAQAKAFRACADSQNNPACIASALGDAKAGAKKAKLADDLAKCDTFPVPGTDDGECAGQGNAADLANCVGKRVNCNVCLALDAMIDGGVNCDLLDDGSANGSCGAYPYPPIAIGTHKCTLDASSAINIHTQLFPLPFPASGAIDLSCGTTAPDGKASCTCGIQIFDPINIPSIGFVCITPGGSCPAGEIDCNGGNALGIEAESDAIIGSGIGTACIDNPDCVPQCDTYCAGLGKAQLRSECVGFCNGGTNDNLPCNNDSECPLGSCNGKDLDPNDGTCQCHCLDLAAGGASDGGDMQCQLPAQLLVEAGAPCDGTDVLITVGTACVPLSTQSASTTILNLNYGALPVFGPFAANGSPAVDCNMLAGSDTSGMGFRGVVNFFGTSLGDLAVELNVDCQ